jgi:hypothetical protein
MLCFHLCTTGSVGYRYGGVAEGCRCATMCTNGRGGGVWGGGVAGQAGGTGGTQQCELFSRYLTRMPGRLDHVEGRV